ncbi:MAG: 30S ribosomal protein S20 [Johnsonella sp.]|nr:30S ribosomal protein S20 [Johnsonella sp.]
MANIKSSKKRISVAALRTARNKAIRSQVRTAIKKVDAAVLAGDKTLAASTLHDAIVAIDKATSKGVYHKNNSSRKVSKLTKTVNAMA